MQQPQKKEFFRRTNFQIRVPNVRVIFGEDQLGIIPTDEARKIAQDNGLDLVEMLPHANPPVCHVLDYSKYKYDLKIKEKKNAKRQRESQIELKELRLTPTVDKHDVETKLNQAIKFLKENKKVQFTMRFSHRELHHKDIGVQLINSIIEKIDSVGAIETQPAFNGNKLICVIAPKKS